MNTKPIITALIIMIATLTLGVMATSYLAMSDNSPDLPGSNLSIGLKDQYPFVTVYRGEEASCKLLAEKFQNNWYDGIVNDFMISGVPTFSPKMALAAQSEITATADYSTTNIQVEGVDEADIIKTDGKYIYLIAKDKLYIAKAYPSEKAKIVSDTQLSRNQFNPTELFIHENRLAVFGNGYEPSCYDATDSRQKSNCLLRSFSATTVKIYDITDKNYPELIDELNFEGSYVTSRKIDEYVYFAVNTYPQFREPYNIMPLYKTEEEYEPVAKCGDVRIIDEHPRNILTVIGFNIENPHELDKELIAANGENVSASQENLYVAQTANDETVINKFSLNHGKIRFAAEGKVPGHILNQFSMDEFDGHFRIATTKGQVWRGESDSSNNLYVLNEKMDIVGEIEDLAPGEKIYSVRFMGKKGYIVTFKKVDPLFVIDLSLPEKPKVLGKLKIPGYSDYLHPYDENTIIGIGKDTEEAEEGDFAWYQGIKIALFDVSDVKNPKELHKVIIGDRGTDSPALTDHKAFLFDKEKELLVIPITLAEIQDKNGAGNQYGDYTFQGAYVYKLNKETGFELKGKVTHYDDDEVFLKSGYYFHGEASIMRSLYIGNVLYTLSNQRLQLNSLNNLETLKKLTLN